MILAAIIIETAFLIIGLFAIERFILACRNRKRKRANWIKIHGQREWESKRRRIANDLYLYKN